jgi:DNA-binding NtrC family response regulator
MEELLAGAERMIESASSPEQALERAKGGGYDVILSDINLNAALSGIDLLRRFKEADPQTEVILISGFGTLETAIEAVRAGAFDYVSKPFDISEVKAAVERALKRRSRGAAPPPSRAQEPLRPDELIGTSGAMLAVYKLIAQATGGDAPVLITGETGTGKELVARAIHRHGRRAEQPFVPVNCGALPEGLLESELFGHLRGAFTGAVSDKKGLFEQAHGGTILLDEIGEMPPPVQVRLLRALERGEVRPVGASQVRRVDVRVIAATHRDLERAVGEGAFRQDLFYRLNVLRIRVPPLRQRGGDVPLLAAHFLRLAASGTAVRCELSGEVVAALQAYAWPGNVRELENVMRRLAAGRGGVFEVDDLPAELRAAPPRFEEGALTEDLPSLDELERRYLLHVLKHVEGNKSRAADLLGIDRRTLYRMVERFGIDPKDGA